MLTSDTPPMTAKRDFPSLEAVQRRHILNALQISDKNRTQAARLLGISLRTLQRKLKFFETKDS